MLEVICVGTQVWGAMSQGTVRGFSVSTRCETVEEFIAMFRDRCDEKSIVVNVVEPRVVGTECAFAILLANKKPVLAGTCVVLDVFNDANNQFKRRGMRLGINRLGMDSELVFAQMTRERLAAKRKPTQPGRQMARPQTMALPIVTADVALDEAVAISLAMSPPVTAERKHKRPTSSPDAILAEGSARTPGSSYVLPANPLMGVPDASLEGFVECNVFDAIAPIEEPMLPLRSARGTVDEPIDDGPTNPVDMPIVVDRSLRRDDLAAITEPFAEQTPPPLEPPPIVERVAIASPIEAPAVAAVPPRRSKKRWFAVGAVTAIGAALALVTMSSSATPTSSPRLEPTLTTSADDVTVRGSEHVEAAPPAPIEAPPTVRAKRFPTAKKFSIAKRKFVRQPAPGAKKTRMSLSDL